MTEAVAPNQAIYRTYGNTAIRYESNEIYKDTLLGGEDYLVYIEFPENVTGYKDGFTFIGPDNGVTVKVINSNTLRFTINSTPYMGQEVNGYRANFEIDSMRVILQKVSNPAVKYHTDIKVNSNENQQIVILGE